MSNKLTVWKARTNIVTVDLKMNITGEVITSEIKSEPDQDGAMIAQWGITVTDASTGKLTLTLDNTFTEQIVADGGFMDFKRMSGGEPLAVGNRPIEVEFRGTVTS